MHVMIPPPDSELILLSPFVYELEKDVENYWGSNTYENSSFLKKVVGWDGWVAYRDREEFVKKLPDKIIFEPGTRFILKKYHLGSKNDRSYVNFQVMDWKHKVGNTRLSLTIRECEQIDFRKGKGWHYEDL